MALNEPPHEKFLRTPLFAVLKQQVSCLILLSIAHVVYTSSAHRPVNSPEGSCDLLSGVRYLNNRALTNATPRSLKKYQKV